ncbi:hypothetical protein BJX62DRAFT_243685 [Aspergillus germanicus]
MPEFASLFLPGYTPSGPWDHLYPIKLLSPRAHVEALIACLARDLCFGCNLDFLRFFMLNYLGGKKVNEERWMDRFELVNERVQAFCAWACNQAVDGGEESGVEFMLEDHGPQDAVGLFELTRDWQSYLGNKSKRDVPDRRAAPWVSCKEWLFAREFSGGCH